MANFEQAYRVHKNAIEGKVFTDNLLAKEPYVRDYFPKRAGQSEIQYKQEPKISMPITAGFINKIVSALHYGLKVYIDDQRLNDYLQLVLDENNWNETCRKILYDTLATGNTLVTVVNDPLSPTLKWELWNGAYVYNDGTSVGYMYYDKDGAITPITDDPNKEQAKYVNVGLFNKYEYPVVPAVLFKSIDKEENILYGKPYHLRFRDLVIEYNKIISQIQRNLIVFQNMWEISQVGLNENEPIIIQPDTVVAVGEGGFLRQVKRELTTDMENEQLSKLEKNIYEVAEIPNFLGGLEGIGKVESGVALTLTSGPFISLMYRIRSEFKEDLVKLLTSTLQLQAQKLGVSLPPFEIIVEYNKSILPNEQLISEDESVDAKIARIMLLQDRGYITPDEARNQIRIIMSEDIQLGE